MTAEPLPTIDAINLVFSLAKKLFVYESDQVVFGEREHWATQQELMLQCSNATFTGDCDDFATWCVGSLRNYHVKARYVVCKVETGELHCIAIADCDGDVYALDNRQSKVVPLIELPYSELMVSGYEAGERWHQAAF